MQVAIFRTRKLFIPYLLIQLFSMLALAIFNLSTFTFSSFQFLETVNGYSLIAGPAVAVYSAHRARVFNLVRADLAPAQTPRDLKHKRALIFTPIKVFLAIQIIYSVLALVLLLNTSEIGVGVQWWIATFTPMSYLITAHTFGIFVGLRFKTLFAEVIAGSVLLVAYSSMVSIQLPTHMVVAGGGVLSNAFQLIPNLSVTLWLFVFAIAASLITFTVLSEFSFRGPVIVLLAGTMIWSSSSAIDIGDRRLKISYKNEFEYCYELSDVQVCSNLSKVETAEVGQAFNTYLNSLQAVGVKKELLPKKLALRPLGVVLNKVLTSKTTIQMPSEWIKNRDAKTYFSENFEYFLVPAGCFTNDQFPVWTRAKNWRNFAWTVFAVKNGESLDEIRAIREVNYADFKEVGQYLSNGFRQMQQCNYTNQKL